tara:strand:- start:1997 stop:2161 length:165 start_codon:yes stop_codon:yes gene_type:complete
VELRLTEAEKIGATSTFFSKVKEELDIVPAKVRVLEYWQEKGSSNKRRMNGNGS